MTARLLLAAACLALLVAPLPAAETGGARPLLEAFLSGMRTLEADFVQETAGGGEARERSEGRLYLARPGRFRWEYRAPFRQLVVGDGERVWVYDPELAQVTVRPVSEALGATPAALLSGAVALEERFRVEEAGRAEGLRWLLLRPREGGGSFRALRLGVDEAGVPRRLELLDALDRRTVLRLERVRLDPALPGGLFTFRPPPGTDVVREGPTP